MATKCGLCGGSLIANPLNKDNKNPLFHSYACEKCGKTGNKYTHTSKAEYAESTKCTWL